MQSVAAEVKPGDDYFKRQPPGPCAQSQLFVGDFIRDAGCNGQLFQISTTGFEFLKSIGKSPVGYIAEMGGM